ncbi:MAG: SDR family oxidoreductase [Xanthobacteraceae bacterium]|jgi:NAD(P)-dependent dehydrogenase (short-subunit alcohol dehydrogenase family)
MNDKADRKVAVVTGGGRGLGAAMALGLARAGYRVVVTAAREAAEIEAIAAEAGDDRVYPLVADVTREEDCERVVDAALARFGSLDILVNNAGRGMKYISSSFMTEPTRFWEADASAWRSVIDTNINGPFLMARAAVRPMLRGRWGRIINISMNRDTMQRAGFSPYGPSKAALESETIIWAQDLAGTGVTVNALLPGGATLTGMIPPGVPQHVRASLLDPGIMIRPLLWMVSPASDGITGKRLVANRWRMDVDDAAAAQSAMLDAGWGAPATATGSP